MEDFSENITYEQYVELIKNTYNNPNSTVIKFPSNYGGLYPGEVHILQGNFLLRLSPNGNFRSFYPLNP